MAYTNVLNTSQRQGSFQSSSVAVPAGVTEVSVQLDMSEADYVNVALSLELRVFVSRDQGQTWIPYGAQSWSGGPVVGKDGTVNPPVRLTVGPLNEFAGNPDARIRCEMDIPVRMRVGASVEVR